MIQNGFRFRELLRPRRIITLVGAALLTVTVEAVKYFTEEAAFENARLWLVARSRAAMIVLQFIAAHAWWIPWGLVPLTVIVMLIWIAIDTRKLARSRMVPIEQLEDHELYAQATVWLSKRLAERKLHVEGACLFGSIMHDRYPTSDVDVAIWFKPIKGC